CISCRRSCGSLIIHFTIELCFFVSWANSNWYFQLEIGKMCWWLGMERMVGRTLSVHVGLNFPVLMEPTLIIWTLWLEKRCFLGQTEHVRLARSLDKSQATVSSGT